MAKTLTLRERAAKDNMSMLLSLSRHSSMGDTETAAELADIAVECADALVARLASAHPAEPHPVTDAEVRVYQRAVADYVDNCVVQKMDADAGTRAGLTAAFALREGRS